MSDATPPAPTRRKRFDVRIDKLRRTSKNGPVGPAELIALAGSILILILVVVAYLYFLVPARMRLERAQLERARLQNQLRTSEDTVQKGLSTEAIVQDITESLDAFESGGLSTADRGRMDIYDSLNQLMRKNGLRNTSGPTYTPLDPTGTKTETGGAKATSSKWQSIYPGIAISVTVEGQYHNLRRFIREIETSKQFVVINMVELERATEGNTAAGADAGAGSRVSPVSLRLDMATYFQRRAVASSPEPIAN
ncbi:MAG TPA: GspMb/PilO family protein [Pyrinomonadaceae bacterium]|nr:GspMb/PilO family protein [Pyrinomonadaceae bacterium]